MRTMVLACVVALGVAAAGLPQAAAGDAFDFGDMPPLPPPLVDDAPPPPPVTAVPPSAPAAPAIQTLPSLLTPPGDQQSSAVRPPPAAPVQPLAGDLPPILLPPEGGTDVAADPSGGAVVPSLPPALPAAGPPVEETPRPGKINGGRVNVRAGPNTQYESIAVLTTGTPVTVLARNNEWYKIVFPADQLASIHKPNVDAEVTGEIPEAGVPGVVNQDEADVHAFYWDKSTVVGKLNKGDPVVIKQERGQWYRIVAPPTARAYVSVQYVKLDGGGDVAVDTVPAPVNPAIDLTAGKQDAAGRLILSENDRKAAAIKEAYHARLKRQREAEEEREHARMEEAASRANVLQQALDDFDSRVRELDAAAVYSSPVAATVAGAPEWAPPDPLYGGYVGWLENIGRLGGAPTGIRLTKGGEIRFYLRSDAFNLSDYGGRRVWVNGATELAPGANANVLNVTDLRVLTESEIADGVRQMGLSPQASGTSYAAPGPVYGEAPAIPVAVYPAMQAAPLPGQPGLETFALEGSASSAVPPAPPPADPYGVFAGPAPGGFTVPAYQPPPSAGIAQPFDPSQPLQTGQVYTIPASSQPYPVPQSYPVPQPQAVPAPNAGQPGPADASMLPDVVGYGAQNAAPAGLPAGIVSSNGEVPSDYYDNPVVSEIGP